MRRQYFRAEYLGEKTEEPLIMTDVVRWVLDTYIKKNPQTDLKQLQLVFGRQGTAGRQIIESASSRVREKQYDKPRLLKRGQNIRLCRAWGLSYFEEFCKRQKVKVSGRVRESDADGCVSARALFGEVDADED